MPNKTVSLPDDVLPIIAKLDVPFSVWIADQLRRYAANRSELSVPQQFLRDSELAGSDRPTAAETAAVLARMDRSAPW